MYRFLLFILLVADTSFAHDFWVEPETFRPEVGTVLPIRLYVGHPFLGESYPRNPQHLKRFIVSGPRGEKAVPGRQGSDPAGYIQVDESGCLVVGYRRKSLGIFDFFLIRAKKRQQTLLCCRFLLSRWHKIFASHAIHFHFIIQCSSRNACLLCCFADVAKSER